MRVAFKVLMGVKRDLSIKDRPKMSQSPAAPDLNQFYKLNVEVLIRWNNYI